MDLVIVLAAAACLGIAYWWLQVFLQRKAKPSALTLPPLRDDPDTCARFELKWPERDDYEEKKEFWEIDKENEQALKATRGALVKRTVAIIEQIWRVQPHLQATKAGKQFCPDDVWEACQKAENGINTECEAIKAEAEMFREGWGDAIFPQAAQLASLKKHKADKKARDAKEAAEAKDKAKREEEEQTKKAETEVRQRKHAEKTESEQEAKKRKEAEAAYAALMAEEDKKGKNVSKKDSGAKPSSAKKKPSKKAD